jgi:hypothetical protein
MSNAKKNMRAKIKGELKNKNTEIDARPSIYIPKKNRYTTFLEQKRLEKRFREQRKNAKAYIGNRHNLRKRWELEATKMEYFE